MNDYFEIDFLDVESDKCGDAIPLRYSIGGKTFIHVIDGGFQPTGEGICRHINSYYGQPHFLDHVVLTHPDGDHAGGLQTVLETYNVGTLWMLRPWMYAADLLHRFPRVTSQENLVRLLREAYPSIVALEEIALRRRIPMAEPFLGAQVAAFTVMAPSEARYLELIVRSERTPQSDAKSSLAQAISTFARGAARASAYIRSAWAEEVFSPEGVSAENEMSVVQYASLCGVKVLLTADAGREALAEVINYAPYVGLALPGLDRFQVPHHGSRRNLSTELLDQLLGPRLPTRPPLGQETFTAIISSAKKDPHHPRKAAVRAMIHRGARVVATEGISILTGFNAPAREGWGPVTPLDYPEDQEQD